MKKLLALTLAIVMALALFGCAPAEQPQPSPSASAPGESPSASAPGESPSAPAESPSAPAPAGEPVEVEILQFKVEIVEQLQAAIDYYMQNVAPNVKISLSTVGGGDDIGVVYQSRAASGDMPDIFNAIGPAECALYMDYLEDLSDQPWVKTANPGMLDMDTIDGKVYGLPLATEAFGLIANSQIFADAGVDISNITSLEQLDKAFADLDAKIKDGSLKDKWPDLTAVVQIQGAEQWVLGDHASNVALAPEFEGDPFKADAAEKPEWKYRDAYEAYMELQVKYSEWKDNPAGCLSVTYADGALGSLALGRVAVIQQGNWIFNDVKNMDPEVAEKLTFLPIPMKGYKEDSIITLVPHYWCVNKQSDDATKQAAKDFLNWLYTSDYGMNVVVNEFGFIPPLSNFGDMYPVDPLAQSIKNYVSQGRNVGAVFKGYPTNWSNPVFGAKVQGWLGGDLTWDQVFEESAQGWADIKAGKTVS